MRVLRFFNLFNLLLVALVAYPIFLLVEYASKPPKLEGFKNIPGNIGPGYTGPVFWISAPALSPDGKLLLMEYPRNPMLWEVESGRQMKTLSIGESHVGFTAFLPDGKRAISANRDGLIIVWDWRSGQKLNSFRPYQYELVSTALTEDGTGIFTIGRDNLGLFSFQLWDINRGELLRTYQKGFGYNIRISPENNFALSYSDYSLKLWDLTNDQLLRDLNHNNGFCGKVGAFSPDGKFAISGKWRAGKGKGSAGSIYLVLWRLSDFKEIREFSDIPAEFSAIEFAPDGKTVFTYDDNDMLRRWEVVTGKEIWSVQGDSSPYGSVVFSRNGKVAFSAKGLATPYFGEIKIKLWDLETGKLLRTLPSPPIP